MPVKGPICPKDRVEAVPAVIIWRCPKCEGFIEPTYNDLPALFENMDKLFKRFRKPPNAILLFADDMTKAVKK
jgi:hypothetical protein